MAAKPLKSGNFKMDAVAVQIEASIEAKEHLAPELLYKFAMNEADLSQMERDMIMRHIGISSCERCKAQIHIARKIFRL